jgi:hypothetical protein
MASSVKVDTGKSQLLQPDLVLARHRVSITGTNVARPSQTELEAFPSNPEPIQQLPQAETQLT